MKEEEIALCKRMLDYAQQMEGGVSTLAYIPPAQALRNAADLLEQKGRDIAAFKKLIESFNS